MGRTILVAAVALVAGCENAYIYRPAENATAHVAGRAAARYAVPPERSTGEVRIASFGVAAVHPRSSPESESSHEGEEAESGPTTHVMHVRLVVANNDGAGPWYFDPREQVAVYQDRLRFAPIYATSSTEGLPQIVIRPGDERTVDLYFPLPAGAEKEAKIPEFDVLWRVHTDRRVVAERTPFDRLRVEPLYAGPGYWPYYYGWGPYGWYSPYWGPAYIGPPGWYW